MILFLTLLSAVMHKFCYGVPPSPTDTLMSDVREIKENLNALIRQLPEVSNPRFLDQNFIQLQSTLTSIDSNVKNLQERAHVWDTFQLHVSAWNDQLSTADRKLDILSKAQEKMYSFDTKLNIIPNMEFKLDQLSDRISAIEGYLQEINTKVDDKRQDQNLFGEFATRGILSTLKQIEKKLDRMNVNGQNVKQLIGKNGKCQAEDILRDIASKVDVIFDKFSEKDEVVEEGYYEDQGSGENGEIKQDFDVKLLRKVVKRLYEPCKKTSKLLENVLAKVENIENDTSSILKKDNIEVQKFIAEKFDIQNKYIENVLDTCKFKTQTHCIGILENDATTILITDELPTTERMSTDSPNSEIFDYTYCYTMQNLSGAISFSEQNVNEIGRDYNARVCDHGWTVIQRRDNYYNQENFNRSWHDYKIGFGELQKDFWFGNDFIHRLSFENDLKLRVEMENFDGINVWAEYDTFKVNNESDFYQIEIGGYSGIASDSFTSHNSSKFSTYDKKNDDAPVCCPCALSYGSGWWFNSCFESNLNGLYYKNPYTNEYYKGIIWEHWLGNYSLKKTRMMVKPKGNVKFTDNIKLTPIFIEDP